MNGKGGGSSRGLRPPGSRIRTLVGLALLGLVVSLGVIQACTRVDVVAVDISSVTITPTSVTLVPGETRTLSVEVLGEGGRSLPLSTVTWASDDPSIASVTSAGLLRGVAEGTTRIRAEASGVSGTATVTVQAPPSIVVQATVPDLLAAFEGADPDPVEVDITNGGGGTLSDLSVSVTYQEGTGGWLTPRLTSSTAPTTLVLTASTGDLAVGRYRATVLVMASAAENSPFSIPVTLEVTDARPFLRLTPSAVGFAAVAGGRPPADQVVRVTNAGGGELDGLSATVEYAGDGDWLELDLSPGQAPADLTLGVDPAGLPPGQYAATVTVTSPAASNGPREVAVSLSVEAEAVADLSVEKTGLAQALVGDTVIFQLTLRNAGPRQANGVTLVDSVPAGLEIVPPVGASVAGRRVAWSLDEVLSGESVERTLVTVARELGSSSNVARATSETTDPEEGNNRSTFAIQVAPRQT
ncbi:MAG: Ig-like domain-containing protein, partial [Gemmatimonadota bacterium]